MATITANVNLPDEYIETVRWYLDKHFKVEVDTDENGTVSNAEAVAWFQDKFQETFDTFVNRGVQEAEAENVSVLPSTHQTAITSFESAKTTLEAERAKAIASS